LTIGSKTAIVNAGRFIWKLSSDEFILLTRKRISYHTPQKRVAISGGNIFYTLKADNKFSVTVAYSSGEVGVSIPTSFDNMITVITATGEIPEKAFTFVTTDKSSTAKTFSINAKMTDFISYGEGEGETMIDLEFQIIDDSPAITP